MAGGAPNPFQMLRFMHSADVILVDIPLGLGQWANLIMGEFLNVLCFCFCALLKAYFAGRWIGGYLLGMKASYKEFDD